MLVGHPFQDVSELLHKLFFLHLPIRKLPDIIAFAPFEKGFADERQRFADDRHQLEPIRADFPHDFREFAAAKGFVIGHELRDNLEKRRVRFAFARQFVAFGFRKANLRRLFPLLAEIFVQAVKVLRLEFFNQPRFANPGFADNKDHFAFPLQGVLHVFA